MAGSDVLLPRLFVRAEDAGMEAAEPLAVGRRCLVETRSSLREVGLLTFEMVNLVACRSLSKLSWPRCQ